MELAADLGWVALGGFLLYLGAEWLVSGAAGLARTLGVREIVVGLTIVAYGTSAPELAVSISANLDYRSGMVLGNVVGSCIANLGLILGLTALISPPRVEAGLIRREVPVLVVSALAVPLLVLGGSIGRLESIALVVMAAAFSAFTFKVSKSDETTATTETDDDTGANGGAWRLAGLTAVGLLCLVGGGELFLGGAKGIATRLGMSDRLVGLTIVAFGTSLPELAASVVAALRGHSGLAIGNVIGSNIFNIFLVLGVAGTIRPLPAHMGDLQLDLVFITGLTLVGALFMRTDRRINRWEGALLVAGYAAFIVLAARGW